MPARPTQALSRGATAHPRLALVSRTPSTEIREPETESSLRDLVSGVERRRPGIRAQLVTTGDATRMPVALVPLVEEIARAALDRIERVPGARAVLVCLHVGVRSASLSVYHEGADDRAVGTPSDHLSGWQMVAARVEHMGGVFVTRGSAEAGHLVGALLPFGAE